MNLTIRIILTAAAFCGGYIAGLMLPPIIGDVPFAYIGIVENLPIILCLTVGLTTYRMLLININVSEQANNLLKIGTWIIFLCGANFFFQTAHEEDRYHASEIIFFSFMVVLLFLHVTRLNQIIKNHRDGMRAGVFVGYFALTGFFYYWYYASDFLGSPPEPLFSFVAWLFVFPFLISVYLASISGHVRRVANSYEHEEKKQEIYEAYGVKGWADSERVSRILKHAHEGIYIGGGFHFNEQGNILTVGGPRGGKGVNLILPALLDACLVKPAAQSWVILDPKGENCAVAAPYLKWAGYNVLVINPFSIPEIEQFGNARFNVFDLFNVYTPSFSSFVDMVLYALIPIATKQDDFFDNAGRELIRFHIGFMMLQDMEPKTFKTLYNWLHLAGKERHDLLLKMVDCTGLDGVVKAGAMSIIGLLDDDAGKTVGNIYKSATQAISVFGDTQLRYSVSGSDFTLQNVAKEKTAIFVCVNPSELNRTQAWLRILFNSFIDNMLRNYNAARKTVFLFDELHKLGSLKVVKDNISYLPGYHVTIWSIVQSLGQLKELYPDIWEDFIGSSTVRHYLSIQDNFTAEYISKRMPRIIKFIGSHADGSPKEIQIPLLSQDEIIGFPDIVVEINGMDRPARIGKKPYWTINDHGAPNPFR